MHDMIRISVKPWIPNIQDSSIAKDVAKDIPREICAKLAHQLEQVFPVSALSSESS